MNATCEHCGATDGLGAFTEHVGGIGYVRAVLCSDRVRCWRRVDALCDYATTATGPDVQADVGYRALGGGAKE